MLLLLVKGDGVLAPLGITLLARAHAGEGHALLLVVSRRRRLPRRPHCCSATNGTKAPLLARKLNLARNLFFRQLMRHGQLRWLRLRRRLRWLRLRRRLLWLQLRR